MRARRFDATILLISWIVYVAGYAWSIGLPDTARDVFEAYRIRHGLDLPLEGPVLGIPHAIHLGPIWFYLLSIPLWIHDSWLSLVLFEGAICGLKIPLAWYCGRKLWDREFGLLWAAALVVPGWSSMEALVPFNPNAVGTAVLLLLALGLRLRERAPTAGGFFAIGLACAFAAHVHPTVVPIAVLVAALAVPALRKSRSKATALAQAAALAAGAFLLFAPYLVSQGSSGWPDWSGAERYLSSQPSLRSLWTLPDLVFAEFFTGPRFALTSLAGWGEAPAVAVAAVFLGLGVLAPIVALVRRDDRALRLLRAGFASVLALSCWVILLRPNTPFYFVYVAMPFVAGIAAAGARLLADSAKVPAVSLAAGMLALQAAACAGIAGKAESGGGTVSRRALDVKASSDGQLPPDFWFPALHRARLGRLLCSTGKPRMLHGVLAQVEDRSVGLDALFECGSIESISLGGSHPGVHWIGLARGDWQVTGWRPSCWVGPLGIGTVDRVPISTANRIADGARYFPRDVSKLPATAETLDVAASGKDVLVVTNLLSGYEVLSIGSATVDGTQVPVRAGTVATAFAAPAPSSGVVDWRLGISTTDASAVDVSLVAPGSVGIACD